MESDFLREIREPVKVAQTTLQPEKMAPRGLHPKRSV